MVNKVIDAISIAIDEEFNAESTGYEIYTQPVSQGLTEPCFSIVVVNSKIGLFRGNRYFKEHMFCIHYFPATEDVQSECFGVQERLQDALELIPMDEDVLIRGTNMHGEMSDGVLSFFVNYNFFVYKQKETETAMETVASDINARGE